jgi:hypothetical protein
VNTGVPSGVYELGSMITSPGCSSTNAFSASATAPLSSTWLLLETTDILPPAPTSLSPTWGTKPTAGRRCQLLDTGMRLG